MLPPKVKARVAVEQASTLGWERYVGTSGHVIGMKTFGASAPLKELQRKFGFEPDRVWRRRRNCSEGNKVCTSPAKMSHGSASTSRNMGGRESVARRMAS